MYVRKARFKMFTNGIRVNPCFFIRSKISEIDKQKAVSHKQSHCQKAYWNVVFTVHKFVCKWILTNKGKTILLNNIMTASLRLWLSFSFWWWTFSFLAWSMKRECTSSWCHFWYFSNWNDRFPKSTAESSPRRHKSTKTRGNLSGLPVKYSPSPFF